SQSQSQRARSQSRARSASSEDSQTVILNASSILDDQSKAETSTISPAAVPQVDEEDVKKCWICFSDETEDTPETSAWRDPCPCALVAHEDCLLDWIADMESPSSRKRTLSPPRPVCPQCKSDIYLARPKNYIVETVKALERVSAKVTMPGMLMVAMSTIVNACEAHGRYSIFTIFGPRDGLRIMQPVLDDIAHPHQVRSLLDLKDVFADLALHWRLRIGLPLITPILVLSRTSLADSLLPVLPIVFFATQGDSDEPMDFASWPPSASLAMAVLPYLRGAYNAYYERVWADKEKRWLKEIQPRNGREGEDGAARQNANDDAANDEAAGENNFEVRIDAGIWEDWGAAADANIAPPLNAPPLADNMGGLPQQRQNQPQPQPQNPPLAENRQERLLSLNTTSLAEKILGALFFPTIASLGGDLLGHILPKAWTHKPLGSTTTTRATGLLQEKWGRSIVGGCLFVVVKDAVMLYVRWKMAMQHRRRRVLDYDRSKKR
ncbi:hypothetical protein BDV97DRAFT_282594, partial [Delphinella strobiligena]